MIALSKNTLPLGAWGTSIALVLGALVVLEIVFFLVRLVIRRTPTIRLLQLLGRSKRALRALVVSIVVAECVRFVEPRMRLNFQEVANIAIIFSIAWVVIVVSGILIDLTESRFDITVSDNRRARRVHTQLRVMRRVIAVVIVLVAVLAALTSFSQGRSIATSILASAGVLGLVIGIAGQSTIGNFIAGVQIAFSDALRIDDVVVVNGDWGRIEEITLTYVVLAIWDQRRLVLPVSYFVTTPFENWTRTNSQILGTVMLFCDYTVPVEELRVELLKFVETSPLWDHRAASLQVVDATEHTVQLRALVSAATSGNAWDLRCAVREHLVAYLRDNYPSALPRTRLETQAAPPTIGIDDAP
ncbi:MAG TPA: mechanosensitive ion channel domain-containing protein [Acidimicrobiales bacterium]|nr:mechanosensitive ion channel domain-containing protein [Acidimicrobiales bacterium]